MPVWADLRSRPFSFERNFFVHYGCQMTAAGVIEEIKHLPRGEQSRVIQFAFELARSRQLPGENYPNSPNAWLNPETPPKLKG